MLTPMASGPARKATYQDILDAPPNVVAELVGGELSLLPRPQPRHAFAMGRLTAELDGAFGPGPRRGPGGWVFLIEPELHFGDDVVVPDIAGWRRERYPGHATDEAYFVDPPDFLAEVLSPSTVRWDRLQKMQVYRRERVEYVWLVDPAARTIEAFHLDGLTYRLETTVGGEDTVRVAPFDGLELELTRLWQT